MFPAQRFFSRLRLNRTVVGFLELHVALANMTEFGRTPYFTAREFEAMGYRMPIWPVSALRIAAKAQETLYAALKRDGGAHSVIDQMQTRQELYQTISYAEYEALDASIVKTVLPS